MHVQSDIVSPDHLAEPHPSNGTLSTRAREQEFVNLTDAEAAAVEQAYREIFQAAA